MAPTAQTSCLTPEDARRVVLYSLTPEQQAAMNAHAATCASCHRLLVKAAQERVSVGLSVLDEPESWPGEDDGAPRSGLIAERYLVLDTVGTGGMGTVYLAHDTVLRREVALKLARHGQLGQSDAWLSRMEKEARALAKVRHPNVVTVYDLVLGDDDVAIAMELVRGPTLREHLAKSRRRKMAAWPLLEQMGRGLVAAHREDIVHGDVKLDNALVDPSGVVRITDFGLARFEGLDREAMPRGGTPAYTAPEVSAGGEITMASDQFSLAASMVEALSGESQPSSLRGVPRALRSALGRALSSVPANRFSTVEAMLDAMTAGVRRRRVFWATIIAALLVAPLVTSVLVERSMVARCVESGQSSLPLRLDVGAGELYDPAALWPRAVSAQAAWQERWSSVQATHCESGAPDGIVVRCLEAERVRASEAIDLIASIRDPLVPEVQSAVETLIARAANFGCDDPETLGILSSLDDVADIAALSSVLREEDLPREVVDALVARLESRPESAALAEAYRYRATQRWHAGRFAEAEDGFRAALHLSQRLRDREIEGMVWLQLAQLVADRGNRLDEAAFYMKNAEAVIGRMEVPRLTQWYRELAGQHALMRGEPEVTLALVAPLFEGPQISHAVPVHGLALMGNALIELGRPEEAHAAFSAQLAERKRRHGDTPHTRLAGAMHNVALALAELGLDDEAMTRLWEAWSVREAAVGALDIETLLIMRSIGHLEATWLGKAEGVVKLRVVLDGMTERLESWHVDVVRTRVILAEALMALGRTDEAELMAVMALSGLLRHGYGSGRFVVRTLLVRAEAAAAKGEREAALALIEMARHARGHGLAHPGTRAKLERLEARLE